MTMPEPNLHMLDPICLGSCDDKVWDLPLSYTPRQVLTALKRPPSTGNGFMTSMLCSPCTILLMSHSGMPGNGPPACQRSAKSTTSQWSPLMSKHKGYVGKGPKSCSDRKMCCVSIKRVKSYCHSSTILVKPA